MRPGIIAKKIGMSNFYTANGLNIPVTILHVDDCKVIERTEKPELDTDKILLRACEIKKDKKTNNPNFVSLKLSQNFLFILGIFLSGPLSDSSSCSALIGPVGRDKYTAMSSITYVAANIPPHCHISVQPKTA